jgi:acetyl esterase/lipase
MVGLACAALALGFALVPWCLMPATIAACDRELVRGLAGIAPPPTIVTTAGAGLGRPYDVRTALLGFAPPPPLRIRRDLPVRTRDGVRLGLDLYAPQTTGPHPTIVVIYGGAWRFGSRSQSAELATSLARLGYTAVAIDYRLAPAYRFPTQLDDVEDALAAIARHADEWGVDPHRVAIFGRSAGAELGLLAAYAPGPLTVRAAIGYYAPVDLVAGYREPPRPDPLDVDAIVATFIGGTPDDRLSLYTAGSPVDHVRPALPPTLLISGGRDEVVRPAFQRELRDLLRRHGDRVAALTFPWSNHAFDSIPNGSGGQLARYYTQRFLAATL